MLLCACVCSLCVIWVSLSFTFESKQTAHWFPRAAFWNRRRGAIANETLWVGFPFLAHRQGSIMMGWFWPGACLPAILGRPTYNNTGGAPTVTTKLESRKLKHVGRSHDRTIGPSLNLEILNPHTPSLLMTEVPAWRWAPESFVTSHRCTIDWILLPPGTVIRLSHPDLIALMR